MENENNFFSTKIRKKRQTINQELLKRLRKMFDKNASVKEIAEDLDLSVQTVYNQISKIAEGMTDEEIISNKKGRKSLPRSDIRNKISSFLLKDNSFNQREIVGELATSGINVSQSSVSRILKKMEFTRKRLVKFPMERNNAKTLNERQGYARSIGNLDDSSLVFLDETGINFHQTRNYGFSPKNTKSYKIVKANRGTNISWMAVIKNSGLICYEIKGGSFDGDSFIEFINNKLVPHFRIFKTDVLIMDNCRFHHRRDVIDLLRSKNITFKFLPAYSPQLNPIEEFFSCFKSKMSAHITPTMKTPELIEKMGEVIRNDIIDYTGWFRNMKRWMEKALSKHEFI